MPTVAGQDASANVATFGRSSYLLRGSVTEMNLDDNVNDLIALLLGGKRTIVLKIATRQLCGCSLTRDISSYCEISLSLLIGMKPHVVYFHHVSVSIICVQRDPV